MPSRGWLLGLTSAPVLLVLSAFVAAEPALPQTQPATDLMAQVLPTATATVAGHQVITIQKALCLRVNPNTLSCNGNDTSLTGYTVTFDVYQGATPAGAPVTQVNVTLTAGSATGSGDTVPLPDTFTYTVCEEPVARSGSESVALNAYPILSGSNQSYVAGYPLCIQVTLTGTSSNNVLGFNNTRASATATPTPTPTPTDTAIPATPTIAPALTPTGTPLPNVSGAIRVTKLDRATQARLAGAVFSISGPNSYSVSVTTVADGTACVDGLPLGTYSVHETTPPYVYELDTTQSVDVAVDHAATCTGGDAERPAALHGSARGSRRNRDFEGSNDRHAACRCNVLDCRAERVFDHRDHRC